MGACGWATQGFAAHLRGVGLRRAQLLPFHQLGEAKYHRLGRGYEREGVAALDERDLGDLVEGLRAEGIDAFVA